MDDYRETFEQFEVRLEGGPFDGKIFQPTPPPEVPHSVVVHTKSLYRLSWQDTDMTYVYEYVKDSD